MSKVLFMLNLDPLEFLRYLLPFNIYESFNFSIGRDHSVRHFEQIFNFYSLHVQNEDKSLLFLAAGS